MRSWHLRRCGHFLFRLLNKQKQKQNKSPIQSERRGKARGSQCWSPASSSSSFPTVCPWVCYSWMGSRVHLCPWTCQRSLTANATPALQWLHMFTSHSHSCLCIGWGKGVRTECGRFVCGSLQVAVTAFLNTPWVRMWFHGRTGGGWRTGHSWAPASLPCWGSPFPSSTRFCVWNTEALSYEISKDSSCSKSSWVPCFITTKRHKRSFQSRLGLLLVLGLAPQCLSLWRRQPRSLFKLLIKVLMPIIISLETMSRPISFLRSLLRDQIWAHFIKAKCQS